MILLSKFLNRRDLMRKKLTTEEFIQKAVAVHGDKYEYLNVNYEHSQKKVEIICKKHGVFQQRSNNHLMGIGCPECRKEKSITHGQANSKEYLIWQNMKKRCYNQNQKYYNRYGGRGITVCDRWLNSFENFFADMGKCPEGCSVDRINNDGNYCPENCRWATQTEQQNNKSNNIFLTIYGKTMSLTEWLKVNPYANKKAVRSRLRRGWTHKQALYGKLKETK
jgi:hypothetical protein